MRVMCIKEGKWTSGFPGPQYGDVCDASTSPVWPDFYIIPVYAITPDGRRRHLAKDKFITLSEIDETELVNQRENVAA